MLDDLNVLQRKTKAIHDPYAVNKGWLFNFVIFIGVLLLLSLIVVSFVFDLVATLEIFGVNPVITIMLISVFNLFKVFVPFFITASKAINERKTTIFPYSIRAMLIVFSGFMTLLLLTTWLSAPNAEQVRKIDLESLEVKYQEQMEMLEKKSIKNKEVINDEFNIQSELIKSLALTDNKLLNENIVNEAKHVVNGQSDGPRLASLERVDKDKRDDYLDSLNKLMSEKSILLQENEKEIGAESEKLLSTYHKDKERLLKKDYQNDPRSKQNMILDLKRALSEFGVDIKYIFLVWFVSLLVTVMLEALILYLSAWLGNTYKNGMNRYVQRKEHMEEEALKQVMKGADISAQAHGVKKQVKHSMEDIYDEFEATTKTFI